MRPLAALLLGLALGVGVATARAEEKHGSPAPAPAPGPEEKPLATTENSIVSLARVIEDNLDRIARGSQVAADARAKLMDFALEKIAATDPEVRRQGSAPYALASLVLDGASPSRVASLVAPADMASDDFATLRWALDVASGNLARARAVAPSILDRPMPDWAAAAVNLSAGTALMTSDRQAARKAFDRARLLAPGSLIEETALRRTSSIAADEGDGRAVIDALGRYFRRFPDSIYLSRFKARVPDLLLRAAKRDDETIVSDALDVLQGQSDEFLSKFFSSLSRVALLRGLPKLAAAAARAAISTRAPDPEARQIAMVDAYAARIVIRVDERADPAELASNAPKGVENRAILAAARGVEGEIWRWPPAASAASAGDAPEPTPTEAMKAAKKILDDTRVSP